MKTEKKNLRRISIVVTAQTKGNLERLAAVCGYSEIGRVVDKLTREKMISLHNCRGFQVCPQPRSTHWNVARREMGELILSSCLQMHCGLASMNTSDAAVR